MAETRSTAPHGISMNGFVLAGGGSRRMGQDKATLDWHGHSLVDHMVQLASTAAGRVRIIGRDGLPDRIPGCGPLGGILTALEITETGKNLILAVDLPLLTPDFLQMFVAEWARSARHILVCRIGTDYPLCMGIDRTLLAAVGERIAAGKFAVHQLIEESGAEVLEEDAIHAFGFPSSIFHNVTTPEDWAGVIRGQTPNS